MGARNVVGACLVELRKGEGGAFLTGAGILEMRQMLLETLPKAESGGASFLSSPFLLSQYLPHLQPQAQIG